jgi:hypothetical protein
MNSPTEGAEGAQPRRNRGSARRERIIEQGGAQIAIVISAQAREALEALLESGSGTKTAILERLLIAAAHDLPKEKPAAKKEKKAPKIEKPAAKKEKKPAKIESKKAQPAKDRKAKAKARGAK